MRPAPKSTTCRFRCSGLRIILPLSRDIRYFNHLSERQIRVSRWTTIGFECLNERRAVAIGNWQLVVTVVAVVILWSVKRRKLSIETLSLPFSIPIQPPETPFECVQQLYPSQWSSPSSSHRLAKQANTVNISSLLAVVQAKTC